MKTWLVEGSLVGGFMIEVDAETAEEAMEEFSEMDLSEVADEADFSDGVQVDSIGEVE